MDKVKVVEEDITVSQAAKILSLTHLEVNRRIHRGQIPARKIGYFWVLKRTDVEAIKKREWYKLLVTRRATSE